MVSLLFPACYKDETRACRIALIWHDAVRNNLTRTLSVLFRSQFTPCHDAQKGSIDLKTWKEKTSVRGLRARHSTARNNGQDKIWADQKKALGQ